MNQNDLRKMVMDENSLRDIIKEELEEFFRSENEFNPWNSFNDKINDVIKGIKLYEKTERSLELMDQYEIYMKNIDKLNLLVNEFKGLVAMSRASFPKRGNNDT